MNVLIIDDDKTFCDQLKKDFTLYFENEIDQINFEIYQNGGFELKQLPDLLFVDIDLASHASGIDIAVELRKKYPHLIIIFTSIRDDLVFNTLIAGVFQFVRKQKYQEDIKNTFKQLQLYIHEHFQKVILDIHGTKEVIYFKDVRFIMAIGRSLLIETNQTNEINGTMADACRMFHSNHFIQIQRGLIVNVTYIKNVSYSNVTMFDGKLFKIGRKYQENFKKLYKEYLVKC